MGKRRIVEHVSTIAGTIDDAMSDIQMLRDELAEWRDNLDGANMAHLPKYDEVSEACEELDQVADEEPEVPDNLPSGLVDEIKWTESGPRATSRAARASLAVAGLQAVKEHIEAFLDANDTAEVRDELTALAEKCEEIADTVDGVSFPGRN